MTDPQSPSPAEAEVAAPAPQRRRRPWKLILALVVLVPVGLFALYSAVVLNWSYSDGDRSGTLYKFSHKGWLCKTWEGELNITPGAAAPTIWPFSVRDDAVAKQINEVIGSKVALHYTEHMGVPTSCFGDTSYFVDGVRALKD